MDSWNCKLQLWGRRSLDASEECFYFVFSLGPPVGTSRFFRVEILLEPVLFEGAGWKGLSNREILTQVYALVLERILAEGPPAEERTVIRLGSEEARLRVGPPFDLTVVKPRRSFPVAARKRRVS